MPPYAYALLAFSLLDLVLVFLIIRYVTRLGWRRLATPFPPCPPGPDAVRRSFQSFGFDIFNYGGCVHVAADAAHLHLLPAALLRAFGLRAISIPWDRITIRKRGRHWCTADIAGVSVKGPAWCLSLAQPAPQPEPPSANA
jgi:hypothetical protein